MINLNLYGKTLDLTLNIELKELTLVMNLG